MMARVFGGCQSYNLHDSICELPEIKRMLDIELSHKHTRHRSLSPGRSMSSSAPTVSKVILRKTLNILPVESSFSDNDERLVRLISDVEQIHKQAAFLAKHKNLICWWKTDESENRLCAIPKDLSQLLFDTQWSKKVPTILTSGTLSVSTDVTKTHDFSHIKRTLGLDNVGNRLTEISKPSPFNYKENTLLYISENVPFPDKNNSNYIAALTDEIERLIIASHGHAAVLFTSYNTLGIVYTKLQKRKLPFPLFRLEKGSTQEIERFKQSGNGVLFASGAMWEGIDIPGDALSMLIIVKLPFAVPDPISEYEQTQYNSMDEYKRRVVIPEMLIKHKQCGGRLIRIESGTGCIAILDCRALPGAAYHRCLLNAQPDYRVTYCIDDVEQFIQENKEPDYFA